MKCTKKPNLIGLKREEYDKLLHSGMFWEWYPTATGSYTLDTGRKDFRIDALDKRVTELEKRVRALDKLNPYKTGNRYTW